MPEQWLRTDMPRDEYDALPGVSNSQLKHARRSIARMRWARENPTPDSPALAFGRVVHAAILEGVEYNVVGGTKSRTTKVWHQAVEKFREITDGPICLASEWDIVVEMRDAIANHEAAVALLDEPHHCEVSAGTTFDGQPVKCRADLVMDERPLIVDLKTTQDASPHAFAQSVGKYGYARQAAYYTDIFEAVTGEPHEFAFIAVEKSPPYEVRVYTLDDMTLEAGRCEYKRHLKHYAEDVYSNWHSDTHEVEEIGCSPGWLVAMRGDQDAIGADFADLLKELEA